MITIPGLSEALIRTHASPDSVSRGRGYYDNGAVIDLALRGDMLQAEVEGSQYQPYRVEVSFDSGGITSASCTCPYDWGGWCKHIVAVLLTCLYEADEIETRPALETLLADLDRAQLQGLLIGLSRRSPDIADAIERQVALLRLASAAPQAREAGATTRRTPIDQEALRRQIRAAARSAGRDHERDYYDYYDDEEDLGEELVALTEQQLAGVELPENLLDAIAHARGLTKFEARRRQMQYIGKLMREVDPEPIRERIAAYKAVSHAHTARLHLLERWRARLLEDEGALTELMSEHPHADAARIRTLVRNAARERERGQPPKSFRALFQLLNETISERQHGE